MVTKDMIIADVLKIDRNIAPILLKAGLHCLGCPSAQGETLNEAGSLHGINVDELVSEINDFINSRA